MHSLYSVDHVVCKLVGSATHMLFLAFCLSSGIFQLDSSKLNSVSGAHFKSSVCCVIGQTYEAFGPIMVDVLRTMANMGQFLLPSSVKQH